MAGKKMTQVFEQFGVPALEAKTQMVGLECEIEAVKHWKEGFPSDCVNITEDGSLRNDGKEFITVPLNITTATDAFQKLHASLVCGKDKFSERTSIHVHADCTNLSLQECRNVVLQYALFEEFFFQMVEDSRRHNIHCVPLTETYLPSLYKESLNMMYSKWHKYTALNIKPLGKFGTIEFRHMEGHDDTTRLQEWLKTIENLIAVGRHININRTTLTKEHKQDSFQQIFKDAPSVLKKASLLEELTFNSSIDLKLAI
jgi:hypothetical protein